MIFPDNKQDQLVENLILDGHLDIVDFPLNLYHLSQDPLDGYIFEPRIPPYRLFAEDDSIPRVCFSTSVKGAFHAIPGSEDYHMGGSYDSYTQMFVYMPYEDHNFWDDGRVAIPSDKLVPDAKITGEVWVMKPVELICVAEIVIAFDGRRVWDVENPVLADVLNIFEPNIFKEDLLWGTSRLFDIYPEESNVNF